MLNKAIGICIGASTISIVKAQRNGTVTEIAEVKQISHEGSPKKALTIYFDENDISQYSVIITGRKFKELLNAKTIPESEAVEKSIGYLGLAGKYEVCASLGGENFIVYCLNERGSIVNIITGNKCASGTGEFFLQQIGRMNLGLDEALSSSNTESPYLVSGRCSVFCKSDCTHALNKGINKGNVVAGLGKMIADKVKELLAKQNSTKVLAIGGVSQNQSVVDYLKSEYPAMYIPQEATYFEALGAALSGLDKYSAVDKGNLFKNHSHSFPTLPVLKTKESRVVFKQISESQAVAGDECILGLDIGSTTTKSVLLRVKDNVVLAKVYLRTDGNPIGASINCFKAIREQVKVPIKIIGLGTTGSGRHIVGLYSLTKGVINEIIAHAVAASFFDKEVDTILEIGGQDAKYTYLINGVASDYAMNEACSAGTGSFLEEAAKESLGINYKEIGDIAFQSEFPINFNDQCAAFISSDIKNASHEGIAKADIVAGLVYSVCMNYNNRVKGNRQIGKKVFMQGGVCYNKAVPYAMANLINKDIVVPPEPGLMGAFGVALEIKNRINSGLLKTEIYNLDDLITREFRYKHEFICAGGTEKCDRKCAVSLIEIDNKKYPFGGACNKYYNLRNSVKIDSDKHDYVKIRQHLVFDKYLNKNYDGSKGKIGISKSFMTNTLFPLYQNFFTQLGYEVVLSDKIEKSGIDKIRSSFCYPVEIAHGFFQDLINKECDYIFLPHIAQMHKKDFEHNRLCVFVQGETYYLQSAFANDIKSKIISPVLDFSSDYNHIEKSFVSIGKELGIKAAFTKEAFRKAWDILLKMYAEFKELGRKILFELENSDDKLGIVLFGRSYNSFASEANLNIPHKFASKGITIIPHDFIPSENYSTFENMYWYSGQQILRSARFVTNHKKLFGVFITNFSCGPDSFIIPYFRKIQGKKPSLTLELDSHSADVGVDTRIDAALDIFNNYLELKQDGFINEADEENLGLEFYTDKKEFGIIGADGHKYRINDKDIEVLIPSMGRFGTEAFSAAFRAIGINSKPLPIPTFNTLQHGRSMASCKECLPFILTTGSLVEYIQDIPPEKKVLFFMPYGYGPCRQGQYYVMLKEVVKDLGLPNVGVLTMNEEEAFEDLGDDFFRKGWVALTISDAITDVYNALQTLALDRKTANEIFNKGWEKVVNKIQQGDEEFIFTELKDFSRTLKNIPLKNKLDDSPVVSIVGEIYVRREEFSQGDLIDKLIENGFIVKTAPITEYVYYSNYLLMNRNHGNEISFKEKLQLMIKNSFQEKLEKKIKQILTVSGLIRFEMIDIKKTMNYGKNFISEELPGETILTVGLSMREIIDEACGVISIGPFNCMPSRMAEAILNKEMVLDSKKKYSNEKKDYDLNLSNLPFLFVESDGNAYPQITQSKIELFMIQAKKTFEEIKNKEAIRSES